MRKRCLIAMMLMLAAVIWPGLVGVGVAAGEAVEEAVVLEAGSLVEVDLDRYET